MILRKAYLDQIIPLIDKDIIKVLTGVRRSGKTVLLQQIQDYLLQHGRDKHNIVYISFESKTNAHLKNSDVLYSFLLDAGKKTDGKTYIFLDEIQTVPAWEEVVSSLLVDLDCDIYITGSNSKLLSGELATLIAGRYIRIRVYPFTLSEAKEITQQNDTFVSETRSFRTICVTAVCRCAFHLKKFRLNRIFRTLTTPSSSKTSFNATNSATALF